ncbi:alpha/beta fold hydrolase [Cytobacillus luteolus]|nr:alpha/beta hydrolase [Cytobacillus luteolus]
MMEYSEYRVDHNGTKIHYLEINSHLKETTPLVIVPGLSESAEDYISVLEKLAPRHCVVITLRGRGKSDSPKTGYTLEDHIADIDSVITHLKLNEYVLMGFSRGVSYAIGYALQNTKALKGLIIGDYPAVHTQLPEGWVYFFSSLPPWRGKALKQRMSKDALRGLQQESYLVPFWDELSKIKCPVLIIRGGKLGAVLSEDDVKKYQDKIPHAQVEVFVGHDHNLFEPDEETFIQTTELFMEGIE